MKIKLFRDHEGAFTTKEHSAIAEVYDTETTDPRQIQTMIDALNPQTMRYLGFCETSEDLRRTVVEAIIHEPDLMEPLVPHLTPADESPTRAEISENPELIGHTVLLEQHILQFLEPGPYILYRPTREHLPIAAPAWWPFLVETENRWLQNIDVEDRKFVWAHWIEYVTDDDR